MNFWIKREKKLFEKKNNKSGNEFTYTKPKKKL